MNKIDLYKVLKRITKQANGCWNWDTLVAPSLGAPRIRVDGRQRRIPALLREALGMAPIPPGTWIHRTCDNPLCVRPDHFATMDEMREAMGINERTEMEAKFQEFGVTESPLVIGAPGTPAT